MEREAREDRIEVQKLMVYIYIYIYIFTFDSLGLLFYFD